MSMTQLAIGIAAMSAIGSAALQLALPRPVPFEVASLEVKDGAVLQDRTVTTDQPAFYAQWAATVETASGDSIRGCEGNGANAYMAGRKVVTFSLEDWTGKPSCTYASLKPGVYRLRASWHWGEHYTSKTSPTFEVTR